MKLYVKANSNVGYLYIFKHGTGPGTVPRDVVFLKEKDLPNGYTAVWLDRFLKASELRAYDIPSETEINKYLDRIGYCQKDGDVVPCDEVEACGDIKASSIMASGNNNYTVGHCFSAEFSPMGFSNPEAAIKAWYRKQDDYIGDVYIDCKNNTYQDKLLNWVLANEDKVRQLDAKYPCMLKVDYLIDCCRKALEGNSKCYPFTDYKSVEACDTKYFANMISASNDPELDDDFLIEGYYDNQRRGLAESAETSDVSALNELANEYANKGYYIVVHNLTDGTITEFSADNWFNDIAPDGGAGLFMSW